MPLQFSYMKTFFSLQGPLKALLSVCHENTPPPTHTTTKAHHEKTCVPGMQHHLKLPQKCLCNAGSTSSLVAPACTKLEFSSSILELNVPFLSITLAKTNNNYHPHWFKSF